VAFTCDALARALIVIEALAMSVYALEPSTFGEENRGIEC
jgi:hypothetical protein